ncbi:MAG: ribosomal protein L11 methyltransferase [Hydrogenophilales bacterium 28-61-23]|nr:MAG: ribosomal protein L11 methyltransferase [Hydrogenophilales bacterium 28-61-23]
MAWVSLKLAADGEGAEALADALMEAGALSVSIEDRDAGTAAEQAQFGEPGLDDPKAWQRNWVVALLDADADVSALIAQLKLPANIEHEVEIVPEQDWVRLTQAQFEPIPISDRLWIVPSWHDAADFVNTPDAVVLVLDPGLAFGTGSHPTTRLCLKWLEQNLKGAERGKTSVLDYGCGSGILAIAARKLGAGEVVGTDVDAQAITASRDNAERNRVEAAFFLPDALPAGEFDVLVANILTNPLKALMPLLAGRVKTGGRIALSGILAEQANEVIALYGQFFDMRLWATEDGWVCLTGTKN